MARHKRESTEILTRNEVSRREFLQIAGAAAGLTLLPRVAAANARVIRAEPALATLVGEAYPQTAVWTYGDRKSTRLNSSHGYISYAVFCLEKKKRSNALTRLLST